MSGVLISLDSEHTTKHPILKETVGLIGMSGLCQIRVGIIGQAMRLLGNHMDFCGTQE